MRSRILCLENINMSNAEPLWPNGAPGAKGNEPNDKPTLTTFLPEPAVATGASIVVCPGGGYGGLATDHEGVKVARWLNSIGVAAFMLEYRHAGRGYAHPAPLQDAQRAIRTVRGRAGSLGPDPERIGIMGFSAGGHLASTASTHFDAGTAAAADAIERVSCRPDFSVLVYPVITFTQPFCHVGSRENLIGKNPDPQLQKSLSNELMVTPDTPPTFLVHSQDDTAVPPENSIAYYQACTAAKVPVEMHILQGGWHGWGMCDDGQPHSIWTSLLAMWMKYRGLLTKN